MTKQTNNGLQKTFQQSERDHILMITNHGIHQWNVIPGLPDTGGQNIFVNQFTETLANLGFKITIVNRGGYPHPTTGEMHTGVHYKDENQRILYIEDDKKEFVRKEDMDEQTPQLTDFLENYLKEEGTPVDLIISHYWDAAKIGVLLNARLPKKVKHVWVPHSLGAVKKMNMPKETWEDLRIDERIAVEKTIFPELDGAAATSSRIRQAMIDDYNHDPDNIMFLPPCVKSERFFAREIESDHDIWHFLHSETGLPIDKIKKCKIITEISRTDETKRKNVLIEAFAKVHEKHPNTLLVVAVDDNEKELSAKLKGLIDKLGVKSHVAAIGNEWERLPYLYSVTSVYCSPSVMEGFGMAVQEAAATQVPVVSSDLIPFVNEYLLGEEVEQLNFAEMDAHPLKKGEGAIVAQSDEVDGFAHAIEHLIANEDLQEEMGQRAYHITIPYFTWKGMTQRFLDAIDVSMPNPEEILEPA